MLLNYWKLSQSRRFSTNNPESITNTTWSGIDQSDISVTRNSTQVSPSWKIICLNRLFRNVNYSQVTNISSISWKIETWLSNRWLCHWTSWWLEWLQYPTINWAANCILQRKSLTESQVRFSTFKCLLMCLVYKGKKRR